MQPTEAPSVSTEVETLRRRVEGLEAGLAALRDQLQQARPSASKRPWWEERSGAFADDPGFQEMVRLGREWREALRAEARATADAEDKGGEVSA